MAVQHVNPFGIHDFKDKERVVAVIRHHWFVLFRDVIGIGILFLLPFFILPMFWAFAQASGFPAVSGGVALFFAAFWTLLMWNLLFVKWTDYYYDIWVITNWRIVDIDQNGLFHRNVATLLTLDHIQDIEAQLSGVLGNVLNFGHVQVQTAAAQREFAMNDVASPNKVVQIIRDALEEKSKVFGAQPISFH
jgi:membrane protein YdbS with pleckstrin-like domain